MVESSPSTLKYESAVVVAEAHFVIVHGRYSGNGRRPRTILCRGHTRGGRHRPDGPTAQKMRRVIKLALKPRVREPLDNPGVKS